MLTDSHAHIYEEYYDDIRNVINEAKNENVGRIITCGCNDLENKEVLQVIAEYDNIFGALGIHPENVLDYTLKDLEYIQNNLNNPKVIAIGEIGLDYHYEKETKEKQIELLNKQLKIAEENNLPVIIHSREATQDTLNVLKKYRCSGIIHSFSGSYETALEYIKMGYLIGINGVITFKNANVKEVIKKLPLESLVLETDSPYLTPEPYRGKKNSPKNVSVIAKFVADLFEISVESLTNITNENLNKVFQKLKND